jgi:superfamily II RNA helicase
MMIHFKILFIFLTISPIISFFGLKRPSDIRKVSSIFKTSTEPLSSDIDLNKVLETYRDEIIAKRGTPDVVDRLENLASKYPGIEIDMDLYKMLYPYSLDEFQQNGIKSLIQGNNVIVTTPTGSGKTLVAELAIYFALMMGLRIAYTTPLKALSNQKFADFKKRYGGDRVGLLTGDIAINRGASITVMTTEVFRNMIYDTDSENQLSNHFAVIFDEFHYMNDPDRGTVWEESVISCPPHIRILALSGKILDNRYLTI